MSRHDCRQREAGKDAPNSEQAAHPTAKTRPAEDVTVDRFQRLVTLTRELMTDLERMPLRDRLSLIARRLAELLDAETAGVFRAEGDSLVLVASHGERPGFEPGSVRVPIGDDRAAGLTGHIAFHRILFNAHGDALAKHPAVAGASPHTPSGSCFSLLAQPLCRGASAQEELIGLLRADNKKGADGRPSATIGFSGQDEAIIGLFGETAVVAIESAELVTRLIAQTDVQERLIASSPDAIVAADRTGMVREFNRRAEEILGYSRLEVLGSPVADLYADPQEARRTLQLLDSAPDGQLRNVETRLRSKQGEEIPLLHSSVRLRDPDGTVVGSVGYFVDVRAQRRLQQRESLLRDASSVVGQAEVLDEGLQQLATIMVERLARSFCAILLMDPGRESLVVRAASVSATVPWRRRDDLRVVLSEWTGLSQLLVSGGLWIVDRRDAENRRLLRRIKHLLGLPRDLHALVAVPLRDGTHVVGQLVLGEVEPPPKPGFVETEEIQLVSAIASQITALVDRMQSKERTFSRLAVLHRISDVIQGLDDIEEVLTVILTGVTAGSGLGFNRAVILRLDEANSQLIGWVGIGELDDTVARDAWKADESGGAVEFDRYLQWRKGGIRSVTTFSSLLSAMAIPSGGVDLFSEILRDGRPAHIPVEHLTRVPRSFCERFAVTTALATAPLIANGRVLGLLVADNKFTQAPIGTDDLQSLAAFATTAAVAIASDRRNLLAFYRESSQLLTIEDPEQVWKTIVNRIPPAAGAAWISVLLIDDEGRARNPIATDRGTDPRALVDNVRRDGISMRVMHSGREFVINNVDETLGLELPVNPVMITSSVKAAVCLPLDLPGRRIGVVWIHYNAPRQFSRFEVATLQLFVNQVAIAYDGARRHKRLETMREAASALAGAQDANSVLAQIVASARRVLRCDAALLWVFDAKTGSFLPDRSTFSDAGAGAWKELQRSGPRPGGTAFRVLQNGWLGIADIAAPGHTPRLGPRLLALMSELGARRFQGVPLAVGEDRLGVLYAFNRVPWTFDQEERAAMAAYAAHAALALENARLLDYVERTKRGAEAVARVTVVEDRSRVLASIAGAMSGALKGTSVVIFEYDDEHDQLVPTPDATGMAGSKWWRSEEVDRLIRQTLETGQPLADERNQTNLAGTPRKAQPLSGVTSYLAVPLPSAEQKLGVMCVASRESRLFSQDERDSIDLFANQVAMAIRNGRLFDGLTTKLKQEQALADLSKALVGASTMQQAMDRAVGVAAKALQADFCNLVLPDSHGRLIFRAAYNWPQEFVGTQELAPGTGSQTGYTILTEGPVAVYDYRTCVEFDVPSIIEDRRIRSGLSVPMVRERRIVGAMLVHTLQLRRFGDDAIRLLGLIANQTAVAVQSASRLEELIGMKTELASLGIGNLVGGHEINRRIFPLRNYLRLLGAHVSDHTGESLRLTIDQIAEEIHQLTQQLASGVDDRRVWVPVNGALRDASTRTAALNALDGARLPTLCLGLTDTTAVFVDPRLLGEVLEVLIDNAVTACAHRAEPVVALTTRLADGRVEIVVADNGDGIPADIRLKLFHEPIIKPGASGLGRGLLLAFSIAKMYGGTLECETHGASGTTMILSLPTASAEAELRLET